MISEPEYQDFDFHLHFAGEDHISVKLLCNVLTNLTEMTDRVKPLAVNNINYEIKAISPGSVDIVLNLMTQITTMLSETHMVNFAIENIKLLTEYLKMKSFLKGKKPKEVKKDGNGIQVMNNDGIINVYQIENIDILKDSKLDKCAINIANELKSYNIPNLSFENEKKEKIYDVSAEEYEYISAPIVEEETEITSTQEFDCYLTVKRPDFVGDSKWEFIFNKTISVKIEDQEWLDSVRNGNVSFSGKERAYVHLKIQQKVDKNNRIIEGTEKYYITRVYSLDKPIEFIQTSFDNT